MVMGLYSASRFKVYQDMVVTENLRLRTSKYDGRKVITVLNKGSRVKIIEIKDEEEIDGIKSNWVYVEVQRNATDKDGNEVKYGVCGWCFGGYLEETTPSVVIPDYNNGNGTIISEINNGKQIIRIRKHEQKVKIGDLMWLDTKIHPSIDSADVIYSFKEKDKMEIFEIHEIWDIETNKQKVWIKVKIGEISGFLYYGGYSPYENNTMEIMEVINSSGKTWTVRKLTQTLALFGPEDTVGLRDKPGEDSKIIAYVPTSYKNGNSQINFEIEAITEEKDSEKGDCWIRITYNGKTGWINGEYLSAERGGPKYKTPEAYLDFHFGGY